MYREIILNSSNCADTSNPVFRLGKQIYAYALKIKSISIPFSFYTISPATNKICFIESAFPSNTLTATLPTANYNTASIIVALETALKAASNTSQNYVVAYNDETDCLVISQPSSFSILAGNAGSTAYRVLGISQTVQTPSAQTVTFPNVVNFSFNSSILLCSNSLSCENVIYSNNLLQNVLLNVPMDSTEGGVSNYENGGDYFIVDTVLNNIDFSLVDSTTDTNINLNGASFIVVLSILTDQDDMQSPHV